MSYLSRSSGVGMLRHLYRRILSSSVSQSDVGIRGMSTSIIRQQKSFQRPSWHYTRPLHNPQFSIKAFEDTSSWIRRQFSSTTTDEDSSKGSEKISVTFVDRDGEEKTIKVPFGMSMLEAAHENDIDLEGACEGSLACSTCHVIVMDEEYYNKLEDPTDEENDMLDLAFGLTETSRLGCQVIARPELDGIRLGIPSATRNFAVDGFVPKPH